MKNFIKKNPKKIIWIYGAQGTGKTTLLRQLSKAQKETETLHVYDEFNIEWELKKNKDIFKKLLFKALSGERIFIASQQMPPLDLRGEVTLLSTEKNFEVI